MAANVEWARHGVPFGGVADDRRDLVAANVEWARHGVPFGGVADDRRDLVAVNSEWARVCPGGQAECEKAGDYVSPAFSLVRSGAERVALVEVQIQLDHIDAGFAEEAEGTAGRVRVYQLAHVVLRDVASLGDSRDLEVRVPG